MLRAVPGGGFLAKEAGNSAPLVDVVGAWFARQGDPVVNDCSASVGTNDPVVSMWRESM
jgi:hypothetical protein